MLKTELKENGSTNNTKKRTLKLVSEYCGVNFLCDHRKEYFHAYRNYHKEFMKVYGKRKRELYNESLADGKI